LSVIKKMTDTIVAEVTTLEELCKTANNLLKASAPTMHNGLWHETVQKWRSTWGKHQVKPEKRSPEINKILDSLIDGSREDAIKTDRCINPPIGCSKPATEFRDTLSEKEFKISGLCQNCQDRIFRI